MKVRFHQDHVWFDPDFSFPPKMTQTDAAALIERGDKESLKKVIEGHMWLAGDITSRFLHTLGLTSRQGENMGLDLMSEGFVAITNAVYGMKKCPRNVAAYLSAAIERRQSEYKDCDNLCHVPPRTQRDRIAKGKPPIVPPKIILATDLAFDKEESNTSVLSRLEEGRGRDDRKEPDDLYDDQIDDDILDLRYDGADPQAMGEVAELAGVSRGTVDKRLRPTPSEKRAKGKRSLKPRAQAKVETAMPATSA